MEVRQGVPIQHSQAFPRKGRRRCQHGHAGVERVGRRDSVGNSRGAVGAGPWNHFVGQLTQCGYFERSQTGLGLDVFEQHFEQVQEKRDGNCDSRQPSGASWRDRMGKNSCWFKKLVPPVWKGSTYLVGSLPD